MEADEILRRLHLRFSQKLPVKKDITSRIPVIESMRTKLGEVARDCDRLAKQGQANGCHVALLKILNEGLMELESWEDHLRK
jgi:hypothetical protein